MKKFMRRNLWAVCFVLFCFASTGCGRPKARFLKLPVLGSSYKNIKVSNAIVTSKEKGEKYNSMNTKWASYAKEEFISALRNKGIYADSELLSKDYFTLETSISIKYGSRALRYWIGFGAGSGNCTTTIKLKNSSGDIKVIAEANSRLSMGKFGGSLDKVIRKNIQAAIKKLLSKI